MTYRVLFVDDEENVLSALRRMLRGKLLGCELLFVDNGPEALEMIAQHPVDVIVSDMRMPGMDGATLLAHVRANDPRTIRIVLSGFASEESILRAVGPAHQYLTKPCSSDVLCDVIERALSLRRFLDEPALLSLVGGVETLPSPPGIYAMLMAALEDPTKTSKDVAAIISRDIAMTAETLKLTNSHYFSRPNGVMSVEQAVRILGIPTIRTLALSVGFFREFQGAEDLRWLIERVTRRSLVLAERARALAVATRLDKKTIEQSFCAGMLAEIGILVMIERWPERYLNVLSRVREKGLRIEDAEEQEFGVSHTRLGGYLMGLWGVVDPVVEAICYYTTPSRSAVRTITPLTMVHVARYLNVDGVLSADIQNVSGLDERYLEESDALRLIALWQQTLLSMEYSESGERNGNDIEKGLAC